MKTILFSLLLFSCGAQAYVDLNQPLSGSGHIKILEPLIFQASQPEHPSDQYLQFKFGSCSVTMSYDEDDFYFMEEKGFYPALTFRNSGFSLTTSDIQRDHQNRVTHILFTLNTWGPFTAGAMTLRYNLPHRKGRHSSRVYSMECNGQDLRLQDLVSSFNNSIRIQNWENK